MGNKTKNEEERLLRMACVILDMLLKNNEEIVSKEEFKAVIQGHCGFGRITAESLVNKVSKTPIYDIKGGMMVRSG